MMSEAEQKTPDMSPTWIYHRDGRSKLVPAHEAEKLCKGRDWADTPAKFRPKEGAGEG